MNKLKIRYRHIPCYFDGDTKIITGRNWWSNIILNIVARIDKYVFDLYWAWTGKKLKMRIYIEEDDTETI